jgi:nickel/cobalt exporter
MTTQLEILLITAVSIGFIHTLTGPDHYLPFIVMGKARQWSYAKTLWLTVVCGIGHVGSSIILGVLGILFGVGLHHLKIFESSRGNIAAWAFTVFGLIYFAYGMVKAYRNRPHKHFHYHGDGSVHAHDHTHFNEHTHIHQKEGKKNITPWILFVVFILGPCEPLIPLLMFPAAKKSYVDLILVAVTFSVVTITTMTTIVFLGLKGFHLIPMKSVERYMHAMAGAAIALCGFAILFLGL